MEFIKNDVIEQDENYKEINELIETNFSIVN